MTSHTGRSFALPERPVGQESVSGSEGAPDLATSSAQGSTSSSQVSLPAQSDPERVAPRKKRASRPKVRTGCITCKIRRIKCDEGKPSCFKCTSTGRRCDGYEFPKPSTSTEPALEPDVAGPSLRAIVPFSRSVPVSISASFEGTQHEKRLFHRFQVRTVPIFSGGSETPFWTSLLLKVGQEETVVRNAIIALGALHEDYQIRGGKYDASLLEDRSYRDVSARYGRVLRQLNEQLNTPSPKNAKLAIICSILFACFEVLRRNNMAAVVHYQSGMRELTRQMRLSAAESTAMTQYASFDEGPSQPTLSEPPQNELEIMMRVFARYDIQACTFSKEIAEPLKTNLPRVCPTDLTLAQVRNHLDNLLICVYQLIKSDARMYRYWDSKDVPEYWKVQQQEAIETFGNWLGALDNFFDTTEVQLSPAEAKSLLGLRLQIRVAIIMLKVYMDSKTETSFDRYKDDFEDVVSKVERLSSTLGLVDAKPLDQENTEFTMELGIGHPLFFVACKCRDWNLRRRAIAQLRKVGKEGVWEGPVMAVLAQRLMRLEEDGITRGTLIPERNRFHDIKKNVDYDGRKILFEATKATDDTYKNWHTHQEAVPF